jgi:hypothetical protein
MGKVWYLQLKWQLTSEKNTRWCIISVLYVTGRLSLIAFQVLAQFCEFPWRVFYPFVVSYPATVTVDHAENQSISVSPKSPIP